MTTTNFSKNDREKPGCQRLSASSLDSWDAVFDFEGSCDNDVLSQDLKTGNLALKSTETVQKNPIASNVMKSTPFSFFANSKSNSKSLLEPKDDGLKIGQQSLVSEKFSKKPKAKPHRDKYVTTAPLAGNIENDYEVSSSTSTKIKPPLPQILASYKSKSYRVSDSKMLLTENLSNFPPQTVPFGKISQEKIDLIRHLSSKSNSLPVNSSLTSNANFTSSGDQTEKVKNKLMSVWNNVKYGWTMPTRANFTVFTPTVLLGHVYHEVESGKTVPPSNGHNFGNPKSYGRPIDTAIEKFKIDFMSRIWLTYRRDFPAMPGSTITTDCGWGCMLRGAQMLLAQALICHFLSRSWRCMGVPQTDHSEALHRTIIKWFLDSPSEVCPLSLHHLVEIGRQFGKKAGDWFGPASAAHILKQAVEDASEASPMLDKICVYVAQDCTVYEDDVIKQCTAPSHVVKIQKSSDSSSIRPIITKQRSVPEEVIEWSDVLSSPDNEKSSRINRSSRFYNSSRSPPMSPLSRTWSNSYLLETGKESYLMDNTDDNMLPSLCSNFQSVPTDTRRQNSLTGEKWRGLVILVPVRLGGEKLNPIYIPCLKRILAHESCLGIIGGKPKHALYFVGFQEDKLLHLDPHYCQETVDSRNADFSLNSFHCTIPKKIPIGKMDPSCTIGFYLRTRDDFEAFSASITPLLIPGAGDLEYPLFVVTKGSRKNVLLDHIVENETLEYVRDENSSSDSESEEAFVLL